MRTHKWLLEISDDGREQLSELTSKDRMAVFRSIAELLRADDPKSVSGVKKLVEKRYEGQYRQRQGDYRIFFSLEAGEVIFLKFVYKGKLRVNTVLHRSKAYE